MLAALKAFICCLNLCVIFWQKLMMFISLFNVRNQPVETMYLLSVPGMRESIIEGMNAPASELLTEAEFYAQLEADKPAPQNGDTA